MSGVPFGGSAPETPLELSPGDVLPAQAAGGSSVYFEVTRKLGAGGEGVVYEAIADDGQVAIVKGPRFIGTRDLSLEREARHLETVSPHPNVVSLLATQKDPRGHTLLFLERVFENPLRVMNRENVRLRLAERMGRLPRAAPPLASRVRLAAPPVSVALELGYELALAIEHVHAKGLVHGDVKPSNLMVALDWTEATISDRVYFERLVQGRWRGVLIDMGGARTAKELEALSRGLPVIKPPNFTAAYAPPEALPGLVDPQTGKERSRFGKGMDVYAFGLTLYQLLTGFIPYAHLRVPPNDQDLQQLAAVKREERDGAHRPIARAALEVLDWSDCSLEGAQDRAAFVEEIWALLARATNPEPDHRARTADVKAALTKLLKVEARTIEQARVATDAPADAERTVRPWGQKRVRLDSFASRLSDAGRDGTQKKDTGSNKIQRRGDDFWDMQGLGGKR